MSPSDAKYDQNVDHAPLTLSPMKGYNILDDKLSSVCYLFWENVLLESHPLFKEIDFVAHTAHHMLRGILTGHLHAPVCHWHHLEDPFLPSIPIPIFHNSTYNLVLKFLSLLAFY